MKQCIHSFIHVYKKYLLNTDCTQGTMQGSGYTMVKEAYIRTKKNASLIN